MWWCFGVLVTSRVRAFWIDWRRFIWVISIYAQKKRIAVVDMCTLTWIKDVAIVDAVLRSSIGRILQRSRICMKQDLERWVTWSEKPMCWSNITPKLRTGEVGVNVWVGLRKIDGFGIFTSCSCKPVIINSVLEVSKHRRFEVIQEGICLTTCRRWSLDSEKLFGEKEMNNWVSSTYKWWSTENALMSELSGVV